jgi:hypothetical protein
MLRPKAALAATVLCAAVCGATFLFALRRQFALIEVAASLATMAEVYLLSSAIGDLIEGKRESNALRAVVAVALAVLLVTCFTIAKFTNHGP